jgi:ATP-dependent protease ClpP protease subunit
MEREILIFDVIEPNTAIMLDQRLNALAQSTARACTIRLNSPGGSWNAGQLMRSLYRILQEKVIGPY